MNRVILQIWEESEREIGPRPNGCSLHTTLSERDNFLDQIYEGRTLKNIPNEYDRIVGIPIDVFVSDLLFGEVIDKGSVRLLESDMNNLLSLEEIITKK